MGQKLVDNGFEEHYDIFAIDFFFHGNSQYPPERIDKNQLKKEEFAAIISSFCADLNLEKPNLLGYSLGGKLCLILLEQLPKQFENAYLLAPDGLHKTWWYRVLLNFPPFRWVYCYYIKNPYWYFWWIRFLKQIGLLHAKAAGFAISEMATEERRQQVYDVWMVMKNMEPNYEQLRTHNLTGRLKIAIGKYDRIIRPWKAKSFLGKVGLDKEKHLWLLDCGHNFLRQEVFEQLSKRIIKKGD